VAVPTVIVEYVDGEVIEAPVTEWRSLRADGVDRVLLGFPGAMTSYAGHSLYWIRQEDDLWVVGGASFYENPVSEVAVAPDGTQTERKIEWVPDMLHADVKLGWWWVDSG
jgi:hypothetical protein